MDQVGDDVAVDERDLRRAGGELGADELLIAFRRLDLNFDGDVGVDGRVGVGERLVGLGVVALNGDRDCAGECSGGASLRGGGGGDIDQAAVVGGGRAVLGEGGAAGDCGSGECGGWSGGGQQAAAGELGVGKVHRCLLLCAAHNGACGGPETEKWAVPGRGGSPPLRSASSSYAGCGGSR